METLKEKTAKGLFWGGMNNGIQQLTGLVFGIILGRLLSPYDYGMMAMISIFSLIASELQSSGFKSALVNMQNPQHEDYNSALWFNVMMGGGIYLILFFSAPLIADYYDNEDLVPLSRYAFLSFVFASWGVAQSAYLTKNLSIKEIAQTGMTAVIVSSVAGALMAWQGFAYWSLATQTNLFILINTLLLWYHSDWRPTLQFSWAPIKRMFPFGVRMLISAILTHINGNILNILIGRYFTARGAGNYYQANQWNQKCYLLVQNMMAQVAQPVLVALDEERQRQLAAFRKMVRLVAFLAFPLLLGLGLVSEEFITVTITDKWAESAHLLRILCVAGAVIPISTMLSNLVVSKGRSDIYMWVTLALGIMQIALMLLLHSYGVRTMVVAYTVLHVSWLLVWWVFVRRLTGYKLLMLVADVLPFALAALAVMVVTYFITLPVSSMWLLLIARIAVAALLYYVVMRLAHAVILEECVTFIKSKIRKP